MTFFREAGAGTGFGGGSGSALGAATGARAAGALVEGDRKPRRGRGGFRMLAAPATQDGAGLVLALLGQVDIPPAGEAVFEVPLALAVADENQAGQGTRSTGGFRARP